MTNSIPGAVRAAYEAGLCILPVAEDGSKKPDLRAWREFKDRRPTWKEMWRFGFDRRSGFGVVAGPVSGNLEAWDFDDMETHDAFVVAADESGLGQVVRLLQDGYCDATPSGGVRWIARYPEGTAWRDVTLAQRPGRERESKKLKVLIELPTFAILAPSHGRVHPSGRPYVRRSGGFATIASYSSEERAALLVLARSFDEIPLRERTAPTRVEEHGGRPGDDFNRRATWPIILEPAGWHHVYQRGDGDTWRRPGKDTGISATTNFGGRDLLHVFSSSTLFEADRSYTKFTAYAILNHSGDFTEASRVLRAEGYGARPTSARSASSASPPLFATTEGWPTPLSDHAFYGVIGDLVRAIEPHSEADPAALLVQCLVMFGNSIGRTAHWRAEADTHYLNLNALIVGATAKGRKGVSGGHARAVFEQVDPEWDRNCRVSGLSSGEGLISAIRDPIEKQQPIKERCRVVDYEMVIDDPGVSDKRLLVLEAEFASTLRVLRREGNTLSPVMRNAWDGLDLRTLTKNSPLKATAPHVSIIGHITAAELRRYLHHIEVGNGFANRMLFVCARRSKELPDGGGVGDLDAVVARLRDAVEHARQVGVMCRDADAGRLWHEVYGRLSSGRPGLLGAVTARAEAQVMRLACLYALSDRSAFVRVEHLRAALAVWRYCFNSARYIFGDALGDVVAEQILRALRTTAPQGFTRTEILHHVLNKNRTAREVTQALDLLEQCRLAHREEDRSGGRIADRWFACESDDLNDLSGSTQSRTTTDLVNVVQVVTDGRAPLGPRGAVAIADPVAPVQPAEDDLEQDPDWVAAW